MKKQLSSLKQFFDDYGDYIVILLLVFVGFILYATAFRNKMFWDDNDGILNNQFIQNWRYFPEYFSKNLIAGAGFLSNYWRPALLSIFSLEWHLWGSWAPGYHFVNTSFHIADAILIFFILFYLFKNRWLAAFTALIFLVHPLQTEAVTYVSGLGDSLSVFFIFLGLFFYLKFRISGKPSLKSGWYLWSLFMYIPALMSKETAIIMPALIVIVDFFFLNCHRATLSLKEKLKEIGKTIWPFLIIAGIYILLRATVLNFINTFNLYNENNVFTSNFYVRLFTFFRVLATYFGLLFWPVNLHMERSMAMATSFFSPSVMFGGLIFLGLLVLAFSQFRRFPILSFGILWFFIGLAPTSNLAVPINGLIYEHWLYLPMIGIFLVLIWLGMLLGKKYNLQKILLGVLIAFLIFLSVLTINRNKDWIDPITFYNQTLKYAPTSYRVLNNLGMAYDDAGDYNRAETTYQRAIGVDASNPIAYYNLGNTYRKTGNTDGAIENFKTALSLDPEFTFSYDALVGVYMGGKEYQEALAVLQNYLNYSDSKTDTLYVMAEIAAEEKDFKAAVSYLEEALKINPHDQRVQNFIADINNATRSIK